MVGLLELVEALVAIDEAPKLKRGRLIDSLLIISTFRRLVFIEMILQEVHLLLGNELHEEATSKPVLLKPIQQLWVFGIDVLG